MRVSCMNILKIFKLIDSDAHVYPVDEDSLLSEMNKSISSLLSIIDMENNIMLSDGAFSV